MKMFIRILVVMMISSVQIVNGQSLESNANNGDAKSQHNLGVNYLMGSDGYPQDYDKAFFWEKKAAEQGIGRAQCNLGICYEQGWGTEKNVMQAEYWYKRAIEMGEKDALFNLGTLYTSSLLHKPEESIKCLLGFAESGDVGAQTMISIAYVHTKEYSEGIKWATMAANAGSHTAEFNLGLWYLKGTYGFPIDYDKAIYWTERAVKAKHIMALHNLPIAQYKKAESLYNVKQFKAAFSFFQKASTDTNNPIPESMRKLSAYYRYGLGEIEADLHKSQYYMEKAAEYNDEVAMEILGM